MRTLMTIGLLTLACQASGAVEPAKQKTEKQKFEAIEKLMGKKIPFQKPNMKPITLTGEVVDVWCYISGTMGPGRGPTHQICALACGQGGVPLGIVEDKTGNVYVAAKSKKPYQGCRDLLLPFIAKRVTITGFVAAKGGCQVLRIETVELAK